MRCSKEDAAFTKEKLLSSAYRLFSTKGFENTTLADIAQEAGYTRGAVYWHFQDKSDLLNQLVIQIMQELKDCQTLAFSGSGTSPMECLLGFSKYPADIQEKAFFVNRLYWLLNTQPEYSAFAENVRAHKRVLYNRIRQILDSIERDPRYELLGDKEAIVKVIFMMFESTYAINSYQALDHPLSYEDFRQVLALFIKEHTD